ncbi:MAG: hypothetical protein U5N21_09480 [Rhodococcus sp. (in: high G+C Gram-positive bacteria)]|nr:hypothetical protein [Rhodococcus sp. (in: high G+C Gram-positive bacteria)]
MRTRGEVDLAGLERDLEQWQSGVQSDCDGDVRFGDRRRASQRDCHFGAAVSAVVLVLGVEGDPAPMDVVAGGDLAGRLPILLTRGRGQRLQ